MTAAGGLIGQATGNRTCPHESPVAAGRVKHVAASRAIVWGQVSFEPPLLACNRMELSFGPVR
jgi:hypothetical protein